MNEKKITAIIVTYNSQNTIASTLDALKAVFDSGLLDCVVVDNASSDDTVVLINKYYSWVNLIQHYENVGFGSGCNIGFDNIKTPYALLINPDSVISINAIKILYDFMEMHSLAGIVSPAIREPDHRLQHAGAILRPPEVIARMFRPPLFSKSRKTIVPGCKPFKTNWLCGAIQLIRVQLIHDLKGFDQRFFLYYEETDFCYRAEQRGWELWAIGEAVAYHDNAGSSSDQDVMVSGCIAEHYYQSRFYFYKKHYGIFWATTVDIVEAVSLLARCCVYKLSGRCCNELLSRFSFSFFRCPPK